MKLTDRPRRLRTDGIRPLVPETVLDATDLVAPIFVDATTDRHVPIEPIPGYERVPVAEAADHIAEMREADVKVVIVFGILEPKDPEGSRAYARNGVVQRAVRAIIARTDAYVITDVCLCEYTDYGHCGVLEGRTENNLTLMVENRPTLDLLVETAVSHAETGADMVTPSVSIDGMVDTIHTALDDAGYDEISIMFYATKYESAFYGPSRSAADGAPAFGDQRHYQMDPANTRETLREAALDVGQGAGALMVKPSLPYLDIVHAVHEDYDHPVTVYNVSDEYAVFHAAAEKNWLDLDGATHESLLSMKRASADLIITYFTKHVARQLN